jgi:branched-chain amino acid transport system substrate-binding protein
MPARFRVGCAIAFAVSLVAAGCGNASSDNANGTTTSGTAASDSTSTTGSSNTGSFPAVTAPGVSATEIKVGSITSATNPLGGLEGTAVDGAQAYFDMVNAAGGVYGRKIVIDQKKDDELVNNKAAADDLIDSDIFAVVPVAVLLFSGAADLVAKNIPTFGWDINIEWSGTAADPRLNMFGQAGSYIGLNDLSPRVPFMAKELHLHKLAVLAYNVAQSTSCADTTKASVAKWGKSAGVQLVYFDKSLSYGEKNLAVQVGKMKAAGVDFVSTCMDTNGVVTLATEMDKQGLDAKQLLPNAYDHAFVKQYGDLFEGSVVGIDSAAFELPVKQQPQGLKEFLAWMKKDNKTPTENAVDAWLNAALFVAGLKAAGPNFDRQKVIDAINSMKAWDADGMIAPVDWTTRHTKLDTTRFCGTYVTIHNSAFEANYSKPGKPFICTTVDGDKLGAVNES